MSRAHWLPAAVALGLAACDGQLMAPLPPGAGLPGTPTGTGGGAASTTPGQQPSTPGGPVDIPDLPSAATCSSAPSGRGYLGLAGEHLEADRLDTAALSDGHRPYRNWADGNYDWVLIKDVQKAIGSTSFQDPEARDPGVGASFGVAPRGWYEEANVGAFAVFTTFQYAFKACLRTLEAPPRAVVAGWYEHTTLAPTAASARAFCERTQASAWMRPPTGPEVQSCVDLALDLEEEPEAKRRWAYVCASVLASVNFLAN